MKKIRVILSSDATKIYNDLKRKAPESKVDRSILTAIQKKIELIKSDPHYGDPISKNLIPRFYINKYVLE